VKPLSLSLWKREKKKKRRAAERERVSSSCALLPLKRILHTKKRIERERENGSEVTRRASKLEKTEKIRAKRERDRDRASARRVQNLGTRTRARAAAAAAAAAAAEFRES
jgi:hypothetical protein